MSVERDESDSVRAALDISLAALDSHLTKADLAAIALARAYSDLIDREDGGSDFVASFGPKLLAVLTALGLTPAARARLVAPGPPQANPMIEQFGEPDA